MSSRFQRTPVFAERHRHNRRVCNPHGHVVHPANKSDEQPVRRTPDPTRPQRKIRKIQRSLAPPEGLMLWSGGRLVRPRAQQMVSCRPCTEEDDFVSGGGGSPPLPPP